MKTTDEISEVIRGGVEKLGEGFVVDDSKVQALASKTKCMMCKHKEKEGHIRPGNGFNPSPSWLHHYQDTHGQPIEVMASHLFFYPYAHKETGQTALQKIWGELAEEE